MLLGLFLNFFLYAGNGRHVEHKHIKKFADVVYKIDYQKEKSVVTFYRSPVPYEVFETNKTYKILIEKLEKSRKNRKAVQMTVNLRDRKVIDVVSP